MTCGTVGLQEACHCSLLSPHSASCRRGWARLVGGSQCHACTPSSLPQGVRAAAGRQALRRAAARRQVGRGKWQWCMCRACMVLPACLCITQRATYLCHAGIMIGGATTATATTAAAGLQGVGPSGNASRGCLGLPAPAGMLALAQAGAVSSHAFVMVAARPVLRSRSRDRHDERRREERRRSRSRDRQRSGSRDARDVFRERAAPARVDGDRIKEAYL